MIETIIKIISLILVGGMIAFVPFAILRCIYLQHKYRHLVEKFDKNLVEFDDQNALPHIKFGHIYQWFKN